MGNNQSNSWRVENNINNGAGTYNNVKGNQTINMGGVKFELHTNVGTQRSPPEHDRVPELPAPYDLAAYQLVEADRLLQEIETGIPMSRKISELRSDIEDFLQVVICVGSAMDFISRTTPQLSSNSFVERITQCAFEWSRHLKQLPADIRGYQTHIGCYIDADSCLRRIFLSIFEDYRWRPWLRNMRAFIRRSSFSSKVSLAVLSTPACNKIFGEALRSLIKESNLLSTPEMENFTDLQHILSHLCQNGPEEDYIYLGNWEIVRIADDTVIDKDLFAKTVKAAMRFDIRIIGQSRRTSSHTCPNVAAIAARRVLLAALAGYLGEFCFGRLCSLREFTSLLTSLSCGNQFRVVSTSAAKRSNSGGSTIPHPPHSTASTSSPSQQPKNWTARFRRISQLQSAPDPGAVSTATPNNPDHDAEPCAAEATIRNFHNFDYDAAREAIINRPYNGEKYSAWYEDTQFFHMCDPSMPLSKGAVPWVGRKAYLDPIQIQSSQLFVSFVSIASLPANLGFQFPYDPKSNSVGDDMVTRNARGWAMPSPRGSTAYSTSPPTSTQYPRSQLPSDPSSTDPTSYEFQHLSSLGALDMGNNQSRARYVPETNINNGCGIFNKIGGNQINNIVVQFDARAQRFKPHNDPPRVDAQQLAEPYQGAASSLLVAVELLQGLEIALPTSSSLRNLHNEVDEFLRVVCCVGSTMDFINNTSPQFSANSYFIAVAALAFECNRRLREINADIRSHQDQMTKLLSTPACIEIFGDGLKDLIARSDLMIPSEIENLTLNVFWVRQPAGTGWYTIPLSFCPSWKDLQIVIMQCCKNNPEGDYIRQGNWEMVHIEDDSVVERSRFANTVKAEMRFDISVIMELLQASLFACPQCGHQHDEEEFSQPSRSRSEWISCMECGKQFRVVVKSPVKVPSKDFASGLVKGLRCPSRCARRGNPAIPAQDGAMEPEPERDFKQLRNKFRRISARVQRIQRRGPRKASRAIPMGYIPMVNSSASFNATYLNLIVVGLSSDPLVSRDAPQTTSDAQSNAARHIGSVSLYTPYSAPYSAEYVAGTNKILVTSPYPDYALSSTPQGHQSFTQPAASDAHVYWLQHRGRTNTERQNLKQYSVHRKERPFGCSICQTRFAANWMLERHNKSKAHAQKVESIGSAIAQM
ncbi:hypothetical protein EYR38_007532 [Pleurotus pulmonarius]|nr:hypothetical protein EYR38_007532 [Pleurotus pulmonarius]